MKKSLIILGILAGVTGVAQAENKTILFGSVAYSVGLDGTVKEVKKEGNAVKKAAQTVENGVKNARDSIRNNNWDLKRAKAQLGVKGNEDINENLSAIYQLKLDLRENKTGEQRIDKAYLGFKGNFGEVTLGKQGASYGDAVGFNDNFQELGAFEGYKLGNFKNGIKYVTPGTLAGFKLSTGIELDGKDEASKGVDLWEVSAIYDNNGVFAGVGYQKRLKDTVLDNEGKPAKDKDGKTVYNFNGTEEVIGTSVGYHNDAFKAGIGYTHTASAQSSYNLGGEFYSGQNTFRAEANYEDYKGKADDEFAASLGYQYNFSDRTYSWVEGKYTRPRVKTDDKKDGYQVVVGVRHDF